MTETSGSGILTQVIGTDLSSKTTRGVFGGREQAIDSAVYRGAIDRMAILPSTDHKVAIYIHLPFCPTQCMSCDRVAVITHSKAAIDDYLTTLELEMSLVSKRLGRSWELSQVLVGGGTPNYLADAQLARVAAMIERHFEVTQDTRMAIECNPSRTSQGQLALIRGLGFKELRFEMREIDPLAQSALGRSHSPELLQDTAENARRSGIERLSFELAFGLPNQTRESLRHSMSWLMELGPDEVVCSEFVRQEQIFENQRMLDPASLPRLSEKMTLFSTMMDVLDEAGYVWLGPRTFVKANDPMVTARQDGMLFQNRLGYTSALDHWVLGFGIGAVSELPVLLAQNATDVTDWRSSVLAGDHPAESGVRLSLSESRERIAFANLGAHLSVSIADITTPLGVDLVRRLIEADLLSVSNEVARLNELGRQNWQYIVEASEDLWWLAV